MATTNIVTVEDLEAFKHSLVETLVNVLSERATTPARRWLKSHEVRRLLTLSPNTLQALRENGLLPFTKIGGVIYYDYDDIRKMLEENKTRLPPGVATSLPPLSEVFKEERPKARKRS
jgi:hypothetical protein